MDIEIGAEAKDKKLNSRVAITVVILSVFMGLAQVKDGNIVQNMAQAQSNSVDRWNEYQATKTKQHLDETALMQLEAGGSTSPAVVAAKAKLTAEIAKYAKEAPEVRKQAEGFANDYDTYNSHDDQFDASDALISIAISIAAVAALTESSMALYVAWIFAAGGLLMGVAGFAGWALKSPLATLLG